jgi:hypothetical protein
MTNRIDESGKYGVRVFKISYETLLIKQTIKKGKSQNSPYVIDGQRERHVNINDDSGIADAIRDGILGKLPAGSKQLKIAQTAGSGRNILHKGV